MRPFCKGFTAAWRGYWADMNSDAIMALSGLLCLAAAVLTGALWDTPVVTTPFRWLMS